MVENDVAELKLFYDVLSLELFVVYSPTWRRKKKAIMESSLMARSCGLCESHVDWKSQIGIVMGMASCGLVGGSRH